MFLCMCICKTTTATQREQKVPHKINCLKTGLERRMPKMAGSMKKLSVVRTIHTHTMYTANSASTVLPSFAPPWPVIHPVFFAWCAHTHTHSLTNTSTKARVLVKIFKYNLSVNWGKRITNNLGQLICCMPRHLICVVVSPSPALVAN
jgi:hypothetical protein